MMGGASIELNLKDISSDISDWPAGWYFARVIESSVQISKSSGNPMIVNIYELSDENFGSGRVRDYVTVNSDFGKRKAKKLVGAIHDVAENEMAAFTEENPNVRLEPDLFMGKELLVYLAFEEGRNKDGRMFPTIGSPFYAPISHYAELIDIG